MADFPGLIEAIKEAAMGAVRAEKPTGVMFGQVNRVSPLQITVEQKMTLEGSQLILSRNVTDYTVEMTVDHVTASAFPPLSETDTAHPHGVPAHGTEQASPDITHIHPEAAGQTGEAGETPHWHATPAHGTEPASPDATHIHGGSAFQTEAGGFSTAESGAGAHTHGYTGRKSFTVHNALTVGEKVILIRLQGGQKFLVIDRLE